MNFFFGKFSKNYPEQFEQRFYAGGKSDSTWYGGIKIGDYVFPIYKGKIKELWVADEFTQIPNRINKEGVLKFKLVKSFEEVAVSTQFLRYTNFSLDLNMVNKSVKSVKSGFFPITMEKSITDINQIDLNQRRNLYIAESNPIDPPQFQEMDIRLLVDSENNGYKIISIDIYINNAFEKYPPLWDLYLLKNKPGEYYTLLELLAYAKKDNATNKQSYLIAVLDELQVKGYFKVVSPVALYDDIIVGRKKTKSKKKEVYEEIDEDNEILDEDSTIDFEHYRKLLEENPNMILYGPPGTGKTYTAQKIIEYLEGKTTRENKSFEEIVGEERIKFITFHQSYSYEEFVEGIRPVFNEDEDSSNQVRYKIVNGIVKELAERAAFTQVSENSEIKGKTDINKNSQIYKISLGNRNNDTHIYQECKKNSYISIGWFDEEIKGWDKDEIFNHLKQKYSVDNPSNDAHSIDLFVNQMNIGDIVLVYDSPTTIRDIVIVDGEYHFQNDNPDLYAHRRTVKWIKHFEEPIEILDLNGGVRLTLKTVYLLPRIQFSDIRELLSSGKESPIEAKELAPCYLIIDEINRGNISKIFGELITLIEKDKRNKLKVTLPYSRKPFSFPSNIYIIGTMNTADRSIAILDTALRRRFTFVELEPDPEVVRVSDSGIIEDEIDLAMLLTKMNKKILKKYDRDHQIGHSYFMGLDSLSKFWNAWYYKIIPLLMDYFYNDAKSVSEIIGPQFIDPSTGEINRIDNDESQFIQAIKSIYL